MKIKILFLILIIIFSGCQQKSDDIKPGESKSLKTGLSRNEIGLRITKLYFADDEYKLLVPEWREIPIRENLTNQIFDTLKQLIKGPNDSNLSPVMSEKIFIKSIFLEKNKTLTINFDESSKDQIIKSTISELFFVYAIVNTLTENFDEIEKVQFLFGDKEINYITGHLDFRYPFKFNRVLLK